jgi:hypothetical protein
VSVVRILIELHRNRTGALEGAVVHEGSDQPQPFHGWLELLRVLEAVIGPPKGSEPN